MRFRFCQNEVVVSRITTDPVTGIRQRIQLGSIERATRRMSPALKANCTPNELAEIDGWLASQRRLDPLREEVAARTLPEQIRRVSQWLSNPESEERTRLLAEEIEANWRSLRATFKARGFI